MGIERGGEMAIGTDGPDGPIADAPIDRGDAALAANRDLRAIIAGEPFLTPGLLVAARWHEARAAEHDSAYWKAAGAGHSGKIDALLANEHKMAAAHLRGLAGVADRQPR